MHCLPRSGQMRWTQGCSSNPKWNWRSQPKTKTAQVSWARHSEHAFTAWQHNNLAHVNKQMARQLGTCHFPSSYPDQEILQVSYNFVFVLRCLCCIVWYVCVYMLRLYPVFCVYVCLCVCCMLCIVCIVGAFCCTCFACARAHVLHACLCCVWCVVYVFVCCFLNFRRSWQAKLHQKDGLGTSSKGLSWKLNGFKMAVNSPLGGFGKPKRLQNGRHVFPPGRSYKLSWSQMAPRWTPKSLLERCGMSLGLMLENESLHLTKKQNIYIYICGPNRKLNLSKIVV